MDTFESATAEVAEWISGPLLARVANTPPVRVVVAGQQVPDENNIEWCQCCAVYDLRGVREARYWMPVVQSLGRRVPSEDYLAGICDALKGQPLAIMIQIQTFPEQQGTK